MSLVSLQQLRASFCRAWRFLPLRQVPPSIFIKKASPTDLWKQLIKHGKISKTIKIIHTINKTSLLKECDHPFCPHPSNIPSSQSLLLCILMSFTWSVKSWMLLWMDSLFDVGLMRHSPSNSWQPWPWARSRKLMAARVFTFACLVVSLSLSRWLRASEVTLACLPSQHPR